jgi:hypothetical protein
VNNLMPEMETQFFSGEISLIYIASRSSWF